MEIGKAAAWTFDVPRTMSLGSGLSYDPSIPALILAGKEIASGVIPTGGVELSSRFGARMTINGVTQDPGSLGRDSFVEVVDYDHRTDQLTAIGPTEPAPGAALHWLVLRAKREVNFVARLRDPVVDAAAVAGAEFTVADPPRERGSVGSAMSVLRALRGSNAILAGGWVIVAGATADEVARTGVGLHRLAVRFSALHQGDGERLFNKP